jgi:hypothetical protein
VKGILLAQPYPKATTCVIVGRLDGVLGLDLSPFREVLWCVDADAAKRTPPMLAGRNVVTFIVGGTTPAFTDALDDFVLRTPNRLPTVYVTEAVSRDPVGYEPLLAELHASLESYHRARVTRQKDGFLWQQHVLQNVPDYCRRRIPTSWKNALTGVPAFVCGAGPSLDVSAPVLARVAQQGVVFSADSALRALSRHGVQADFGVSVDVAKVPEKCLPDILPPVRVVLSAVSPPGWASAMPQSSRYFLSSAQLTLDWLAAQGIARTDISVTESCGSTALELARYLGCAPIYLFGLDLAADTSDPTKRHHSGAEKSIYTNSGYNAEQKQPLVPGNYVDQIPTFIYGDWRALNARLGTWPAGLVFNVNDRGARLSNATLVHPDAFTLSASAASGSDKSISQASQLSKPTALATLPQPATDAATIAMAVTKIRQLGGPLVQARGRLQSALDCAGPAAVVTQLRTLLAQPGTGHILGAFSLKLMPHLLPPIEGDRVFWQTQLDELHALAELTQRESEV